MSKSTRELRGKKITNYRFFPMLFRWKIEGCGRFKTADFGHSNYESVIFLTQIYHLSTTGRVKLELGNSERPNIHSNPRVT